MLLVTNPQQFLPLAKVTFEAHAFGNLESRDQAPLDLLPTFSRSIASRSVFPSRAVEVSCEFVVFASLQFSQNGTMPPWAVRTYQRFTPSASMRKGASPWTKNFFTRPEKAVHSISRRGANTLRRLSKYDRFTTFSN
jgi:hypothetical protein